MKPTLPFNTVLRTGAVCALMACALPALSQTEPTAPPLAASSPAAAASAMSMAQVIEHLGARGYNDIREVERKSDKLFEVKTRDAQGVRRELLVDARSGEVLKSERDD